MLDREYKKKHKERKQPTSLLVDLSFELKDLLVESDNFVVHKEKWGKLAWVEN